VDTEKKEVRPGEIQISKKDVQQRFGTKSVEQDSDLKRKTNLGAGIFSGRMNLILLIDGGDDRLVFEMKKGDELVVGRFDPATKETPDIDLTKFDAIEKGVSRRHAIIKRKSGSILYLEDLESGNGTWLMGDRMFPKQRRIVRDGDEIRLGRLKLYVHFEKGTAPLD
jgi:hypothetical protein